MPLDTRHAKLAIFEDLKPKKLPRIWLIHSHSLLVWLEYSIEDENSLHYYFVDNNTTGIHFLQTSRKSRIFLFPVLSLAEHECSLFRITVYAFFRTTAATTTKNASQKTSKLLIEMSSSSFADTIYAMLFEVNPHPPVRVSRKGIWFKIRKCFCFAFIFISKTSICSFCRRK